MFLLLAGLNISETADVLGFSHITMLRSYTKWSKKKRKSPVSLVDARVKRRIARLIQAHRNITVIQKTTYYN